MKRHLCVAAVAALGLFAAEGALAQTATQNITLNATVPGYCTVGGGGTASTSATIPVTNGAPNTAQITVAGLGSVICNENATLTLTTTNGGVTSTGTTTPGTPPTGFSNRIDYTAVASYGTNTPASATLLTSGTAGASSTVSGANTDGASSGLPFSVKITPSTPAHTLVAGTAYSDTLSVLLTPHL